MSQIQNQNPGSTEIQSPLIAGITEALNKISSVLSMNVGSLSDAQLIPVSIDENENNQRRIYEASQGNRLWLSEPAPVFKINGSVITREQYSFSIDYVGGSITFTTSQKPSASDKVTVTASYIINQSKFVNDINSAVSDLEEKSARYKGSFEDKDDLILEYPSGQNGDFAILLSPFAIYAWKNDGWYDTRSIEDLSDYYKKPEINNLLNQKEPTIPNKGSSASDDNYYWGGRKTWQDLFAKVRSVTLIGLNTATSTAVTATDTILSSIGKLQGQVNKIISDGFGFKSFSKSVFPEDGTGNIDPTSPMLMSSLTATSAADRLDHVVVPGKTVQAGSGDPSPANVRALSGVGQFGTKIQVPTTGWETVNGVFFKFQALPFQDQYNMVSSIGVNVGEHIASTAGFVSASENYEYAVGAFAGQQGTANAGRMYIKAPFSSVEDLQEWLTSNPQWVIYQSTTEPAQMYTWEAVDGDTYAAVGLPLNGPLYDDDKVSNDEPSGCDAVVTFDGSEDESWTLEGTMDTSKERYKLQLPQAVDAATNAAYQAFSSWLPLTPVGKTYSLVHGFSIASGALYVYDEGEPLEDWKAKLKNNPLHLWYRTTSYTPKNDTRAEIETHKRSLKVLDGTENWKYATDFEAPRFTCSGLLSPLARENAVSCSQYKTGSDTKVDNTIKVTADGFVVIVDKRFTDAESFKTELSRLYASGSPVTILYELATPAVYAHPAQPLANPAGTWTLSAENTPQGYMRALSDANRADYAEQAKQADTADQLAGQSPAWYMPPGLMAPFAGSTAPAGWLLCDGSTVSRTTYAALFAVIGATYGAGDGSTTFALPDMRGRVAAGANASNALASKAGADSKQIARANLPAEKLNLEDNGIWIVDSVQTGSESGKTLQMGTRSGAARLETNTLGSGTAFDVRQATLYLNYIIKY